MINETFVEASKAAAYNHSLFYLWGVCFLFILLVAFGFKKEKTRWGAFFVTWGIALVASFIAVLFLVRYPHKINDFTAWSKTTWASLFNIVLLRFKCQKEVDDKCFQTQQKWL